MKALVLGCGEMGQEAIRDLVAHGVFTHVVAACRHPEPAEAFVAQLPTRTTRVSTQRIDVQDHDALVGLMRESDVVCNLAGPNYRNAVPVVRAAIAARRPMVDVSDDWEATLEILDLHGEAAKAGITVVVGLGASPGVTNVLARYGADRLDRVDAVHTAWIMRGSDPGGPALAEHLLYSLPHRAFVFADGRIQAVRPFVDGRETRYADDKATFLPASVNELIVSLGKVARSSEPVHEGGVVEDAMTWAARRLHRICKSMTDVPKTGALRTEVCGERDGRRVRLIYSAAGRIGIGTGIPASIGAHLLAIGKLHQPGVYPPEACIDPEWFLLAVSARNIGAVEERVIEE